MRTRRAALRALINCTIAAASTATAPWPTQAQPGDRGPSLPRADSLQNELVRAVKARQVLVVMVSLHDCAYCTLVRESYLAPLQQGGQPVVQIELSGAAPLVDAQGRPSTHERVARDLGVRFAPTVLFLGRGGVELAPRLVGIASPDFYGAYLQERLDTAQRALAM